MKVAILGAGAFGGALGTVLAENGHEVAFYDPYKYPQVTLAGALHGAEVAVLATPSNKAADVLAELPEDLPLISATKGFLTLAPFGKFTSFAILSGGAFAAEVEAKKPAKLAATSDLAQELFQTEWLKIERTEDLFGMMLCGSLKNIYAIGAGAKGLEQQPAELAQYIDMAVAELKDILVQNGGRAETAELPCGRDDLRLTCASAQSRNYQFGQYLAMHEKIDLREITVTTEGLSAVLALSAAKLNLSGAPTLSEIIERVHNALK